jgi:hypothetical protein
MFLLSVCFGGKTVRGYKTVCISVWDSVWCCTLASFDSFGKMGNLALLP